METIKLGSKVNIILKRNYGPYLNGKPILKAGQYVGIVFGWNNCRQCPSNFKVTIEDWDYYLEPIDVAMS